MGSDKSGRSAEGKRKRLSLHPLTEEEALRALLATRHEPRAKEEPVKDRPTASREDPPLRST